MDEDLNDTDVQELRMAEFKDDITASMEAYKEIYQEYFKEQGFSFNEGFLLMRMAFLQNGLDQLAGATFAIEETINPSEEE